MSSRHAPTSLPLFVSRQVTEARRFFLNLNPDRDASLEVVCGGVERMRPEYRVDRTDFPYFAIELVTEGEGDLILRGKPHSLKAGTIFAYGPRTPHTILNRSNRGMRKYYLDFVGTRARMMLREAGLISRGTREAVVSIGRIHEVTEIFEMLIRYAGEGGPLVPAISQSLTDLLFLKIRQLRLPEGGVMPKAYATFESVRRHIDQHCATLQTAREIASDCEITPVHLSRLFSRFADCGAYQYLLRRKMNCAAGLLMNEGLLVKEVAHRLKFADAFHFSRAFKRVYGISPIALTQRPQS